VDPPNRAGRLSATFKFLEPVDWLNQRLSGRFAASHDSIALHWVTDNRQIGAIDYAGPCCVCGTGALQAARSGAIVHDHGPAPSGSGRPVGAPGRPAVATGTGDVHSAAIGSGAVTDFAPHLYIGTSSWISCHVPFKKTDALRNVASIPAALPGKYLVADEHETAGACLTFLAGSVLFGDDALGRSTPDGNVYQLLDEWQRQCPGRQRHPVHPMVERRAVPGRRPYIRGGFHNLSLATSRPDLVRAVYEGVALNTRCSSVRSSALWDGDSIHLPSSAEGPTPMYGHRSTPTSPVGASVRWPIPSSPMYGRRAPHFLALGRVKVEDISDMVDVRATFEPDLSQANVYDKLYPEFVNLYKRTKQIHKRLNHH